MAKVNDKKIYLSDVFDENMFDKLSEGENKIIFDKTQILEGISKSGVDKSVYSHMLSKRIMEDLVKIMRNKKIKHIFYLLYTSSPSIVKESIESKIFPNVNSKLKSDFFLITTKENLKEYSYKKSDYSDIYIKD